jgi:hypothetical protein
MKGLAIMRKARIWKDEETGVTYIHGAKKQEKKRKINDQVQKNVNDDVIMILDFLLVASMLVCGIGIGRVSTKYIPTKF